MTSLTCKVLQPGEQEGKAKDHVNVSNSIEVSGACVCVEESTGLFPGGQGLEEHTHVWPHDTAHKWEQHSPQILDRNSERQLWCLRRTETPRRQLEAAREAVVRAGSHRAQQGSQQPPEGGRERTAQPMAQVGAP